VQHVLGVNLKCIGNLLMQCDKCLDQIRECFDPIEQWSNLYSVILCLETEEAITPATSKLMQDYMQWMKLACYKESDRLEEQDSE
jgi:hypothetical protein